MRHRKPDLVPVALDVRCLQDPEYATRGVGRHVSALLAAAPSERVELIGIVDERRAPLSPESADLLDSTVPNAYAAHRQLGAARRPGAFVSASPMTHDPTFTGRLANAPGILHAALVYDFIPLLFPERYLTTAAVRVDYANQLCWLASADLFAPISQSTADDLVRILDVSPARVLVTGVAMSHDIPPVQPGRPRGSVLVVGGADPRKSPEVAIAAHAGAAAMQAGRVPLVVAGNYGEAAETRFRTLASDRGGDPALLRVPGFIDDAELAALYADARIVVCASAAEGFSLPVIEGMAAGAVVLATDIPAHAELVTDPGNRFPVGDAEALAALLDTWWDRAPGAAALLARQLDTAARFQPEAVGSRFWSRLLRDTSALPAAPAIGTGRRPTVAFMTPLPPDRSGVADYTALTCAEMSAFAEIHCYTPTARPAPVKGVELVQPLSALPALLPSYDAVVGVIGNSHFHQRIFDHVLDYGAAVIAHDARMLGFYNILLGADRALDVASRELGRPVSQAQLDSWMGDERRLEALFLGEVARAAHPMIVHSPVTAGLVRERYGVTPAYLPFSIYRSVDKAELSPGARQAARQRLGIPPGERVVASFGLLSRDKGLEESVWALALLRGWGVPARLFFAGDAATLDDGGAALHALAAELGVSPFLHLEAGYLPESRYRDVMLAADAGIQLRSYGLGGLSGAVLDCAAAGLPTVVNQSLVDAVQPPGFVRAIPDGLSSVLLAESVAAALETKGGRAATAVERDDFAASRDMRAYAAALCGVLDLGAP